MSTSDRLAGPDPRPGPALDGQVGATPRTAGPPASRGSTGAVTLEVPAGSESLRLVRLLASGMASGEGLDIEAVDDVRIAVDELANALVAVAQPGSVLTVRFTVAAELRVDGSVPCGAGEHPALDPLAAQIVKAVATSHSLLVEGDEARLSATFALPRDHVSEPS